MATGLYFQQQTSISPINAAPLTGYSDIKAAPGINIVGANGSNSEIPGDYGHMFKLTDYVSYEPFGQVAIDAGFTGSQTKVYRYSALTSGPKGVWIRNAGLYNGRSIDLKFVIDDLAFQKRADQTYPYFRFFAVAPSERGSIRELPADGKNWNDFFLLVGSGQTYHSDYYSRGDKASYHYEFYDHETGNQLYLKGTWNFNNINTYKKASIPFSPSDYTSMFVRDTSDILYNTANGTFEMSSNSFGVNLPSSRLTHLFSQKEYQVGMEFLGEDSAYPPGYYSDPMGIMYSTESIARIAPATPIIFGMKNQATHTNSEYKKMYYSILQNVSDNSLENRNTSFQLKTAVPSAYDIESIQVYEYGTATELSGLFTITINGAEAILKAKDPKSDAFNGRLFEIKVKAKPNTTFSFNRTTYGYQRGGVDDGYMTFELGGPTTSVSYTYKSLFNNTLNSEVINDQSKAKVLYEGIPDADPKVGVTFLRGTDFSAVNRQTAYLDNIRVDTENPIDEPVVVSYHPGRLPNSSLIGKQNLWLILTTAKGVTEEKIVEITIVETTSTLKIEFVDELGKELHLPLVIEMTIGEHINLAANSVVGKIIAEINAQNYDLITRPTNETDFVILAGENKVQYQFKFAGELKFVSAPTLIDFGQQKVTTKIQTNQPTVQGDLTVQDSRSSRKTWRLTARITKPLSNGKDTIEGALRYVYKGRNIKLSADAEEIARKTNSDDTPYKVNSNWSEDGEGLKLQTEIGAVKSSGNYQAEIEWELTDAP